MRLNLLYNSLGCLLIRTFIISKLKYGNGLRVNSSASKMREMKTNNLISICKRKERQEKVTLAKRQAPSQTKLQIEPVIL